MEVYNQISFLKNNKAYKQLQENSYFFKSLNRGDISYNDFVKEMKVKYKERVSDKLSSAIDNMELVSSVLNVLK